MLLKFIKISISIIWVIFLLISLMVFNKTTKKTVKAEKKTLNSILLLILGTILLIIYNTQYGTKLIIMFLNKMGIKNTTLFFITIILISLIIKIFRMSLKIQTLNSMIQKIDQRYSINENYSEYEKRKNNPRKYRSQ